MVIAFTLVGVVAFVAANNGGAGILLPQPEERRSVNGTLDTTLRVVVSHLNGPISFTRRSYEGAATGPTLRVKPGDTLRILLHNQLGAEDVSEWGHIFQKLQQRPTNGNWFHDMDVYSFPNVTNLHLHGLHVDPTGIADNVTRRCGPQEQMQWEYFIPNDHPAGLYWYHPHYHQASALQLASGMVGALIVEDDPTSLPPEIAAMKEVLMVVHEVSHSNMFHNGGPTQSKNVVCYFCIDNFMWPAGDRLPFNKSYNTAWAQQCGSHLKKQGLGQPFDCEYLLINGEFQPVVEMQPGEWQRWRLLHSAHSSALRFELLGCEILELARDGIYLDKPREVTGEAVVVTAGARLDMAVRCPGVGIYTLSALDGGFHNETNAVFPKGNLEPFMPVVWPREVLSVRVDGRARAMATPYKNPFNGKRDLRKVQPDVRRNITYDLTGFGAEAPFDKTWTAVFNGGTFKINNMSFTGRPEICMTKGTIEEWTVFSAPNRMEKWIHSFHIHVNSFQVVAMDAGATVVPGQKLVESMSIIGDWRDTIQIPAGGSVTFRMSIDDFTGVFPFHCHVVTHQAIGMMMMVEVKDSCP